MCTTNQIFHWTERPWTSLYVYYTHSVFRCLSGMWSTVFMRINIKKVKTKKMFLCQHPEVMSGTTVTRTLSHEMEVGKIITATIQITERCNLIWFDFDLILIWYNLRRRDIVWQQWSGLDQKPADVNESSPQPGCSLVFWWMILSNIVHDRPLLGMVSRNCGKVTSLHLRRIFTST